MKKTLLLIGSVVLLFSCAGSVEEQAKSDIQDIENQVAEDAVKQYEIAKRSGDKVEIYTHASLVAASYLQAKDEENYKKWKEIERQAAKAAGIPTE